MIEPPDRESIALALPLLEMLGGPLREEFFRKSTLSRIPAGRDLMAEGDRIEAIPLVISGTIRVYSIGESGREITLYRFSRGECCVLTADSILGGKLFPASAQVEDEVLAAFIPAAVFDDWINRSPEWRAFVFEAMSRRLFSLMDTLDDVAFGRMDARVASLLLATCEGENKVSMTHQEVADELGSSREVISRILEDLQSRGLIRLARGSIQLLDVKGLQSASLV